MNPGLAMRPAIVSAVLTIALTGVVLSSPASAKPQDSDADLRLGGSVEQCLVTELGQWHVENAVAQSLGGAIKRRTPGKVPESEKLCRPGAQVVAPFDTTIMFAQPYEEYGQLLILSTCGGYHFVLAGMTKIYGVEGQKVLEGEPVGVMDAGDALSAGAGPELYFEIRRGGKPINPLPWLATAKLERTSP